MRPKERRESGEQDLFRARLDQIIDKDHALVRLARTIDWGFLEATFGAIYEDGAGRPPLPTRLMAGLAILKHTYDLTATRRCASCGWKTRITSTFAARSSSSTGCRSIAHR